MQKRYNSVYYLKFLATFFITNSHLLSLYPDRLSFMAFGGMFGNCLFFFVSGFCLTKRKENFFIFMLRRIIRVYLPYLLFLPFILNTEYVSVSDVLEIVFPMRNYHFIPSIIVLYPLYYLCMYLNEKTKIKYYHCFFFVLLFQLVYYYVFFDFSYNLSSHFKMLPMLTYFQVMLLGGVLREQYRPKRFIFYIIGIVLSFCLFVIQARVEMPNHLKILQLLLATLFVFCLASLLLTIENKLKTVRIIELISSLTLEIYLVQYIIIEAFTSIVFPTNIIFAMIAIVGTAFSLNWLTKMVTALLKKTKLAVIL